MDSGLQADPLLLQLPDECLLAVLRCFADDIRSLFSAARAHNKLHQAAVQAVSSITAMGLEQDQARSILLYLGNHGQHVDSIDLRSNGHTASLRQLPHNKVQKLSSLNVSRCRLQLQPGYGFQGVLWAGAPLKQLRLESCMLSDNIEQVAAALSLLPELQHLCFDGNQLSNKPRLCFPSSVLQKLQQLTYLELAGNQLEGPDGLQHVHDLTCLQDLRLQYVSGATSRLAGCQAYRSSRS
jgi:Leucine-rich repeat (LRR) protein